MNALFLLSPATNSLNPFGVAVITFPSAALNRDMLSSTLPESVNLSPARTSFATTPSIGSSFFPVAFSLATLKPKNASSATETSNAPLPVPITTSAPILPANAPIFVIAPGAFIFSPLP